MAGPLAALSLVTLLSSLGTLSRKRIECPSIYSPDKSTVWHPVWAICFLRTAKGKLLAGEPVTGIGVTVLPATTGEELIGTLFQAIVHTITHVNPCGRGQIDYIEMRWLIEHFGQKSFNLLCNPLLALLNTHLLFRWPGCSGRLPHLQVTRNPKGTQLALQSFVDPGPVNWERHHHDWLL